MLVILCTLLGIVLTGIIYTVFEIVKHYRLQFVSVTKCPECLEPVSQKELDVFGGICEQCATTEHDHSPLFLPGDRLIYVR